ncbi:MAG: GTP 3',8-cyclase MoaA [Cyanobacteria bacterium HKST-UBA03]|nr:GTP 3',8-cyclase MoaA [Cyanobacteria bacterium HKST-UBA03]
MPTPSGGLLDQHNRQHNYLRISVTDRCSLRCTYCMPAEGIDWKPRQALLNYEEIIRLAKVFVELGVNKIRLTGGEPSLRHNLHTLIEQLALLPNQTMLAMTTNGLLLPQTAKLFKAHGLTSLNISLDTLKADRFKAITQFNALGQVLDGIDAAIEAGYWPLKINMVVMAGINEDEIMDFVDFVKDKPLNVRFIEFMPFKNNQWGLERFVPYNAVRQQIETRYALQPIRTEPHAVAKDFAIEGHTGTVSFITSMSQSFCSTCNRIRLTADGAIKSCLFDPAEVSLRDAMRCGASDEELKQLIRQTLWNKSEGHAPAEEILAHQNRPMIAIGG